MRILDTNWQERNWEKSNRWHYSKRQYIASSTSPTDKLGNLACWLALIIAQLARQRFYTIFSAVLGSKFHHFRRSERSAKPLRTARQGCRANRFYTVLLCRTNVKLHHLTILGRLGATYKTCLNILNSYRPFTLNIWYAALPGYTYTTSRST